MITKQITITQFLRPHGNPQTLTGEVRLSDEAAAIVDGMVLSAEVLIGGEVAVYARMKTDHEDDEIMRVTSNDDSVREAMADVIEQVQRRHAGQPA